jgi:hypothetical protein
MIGDGRYINMYHMKLLHGTKSYVVASLIVAINMVFQQSADRSESDVFP